MHRLIIVLHYISRARIAHVEQMRLRLGVDIGRVIIGPPGLHGSSDTSFLRGSDGDAMRTPPMPDAFESIHSLTELFDGQVWLVSKAGPRIEARTRRWLEVRGFFRQTGVPADNLRFCRERRQKADHCRELGITDFIDDRIEVLQHLRGVTPRLYLFGPQTRIACAPEWTTHVLTWREANNAVQRRVRE